MKKKTKGVKLDQGSTQFDRGNTKFDKGKVRLGTSGEDICFVSDYEGSQGHPAKPRQPLNMKFIE